MTKKNNDISSIQNKELLQSIENYQTYHGVKEENDFITNLEKSIFLFPIKKERNYMVDMAKEDGTPIHFLLIHQPTGDYLPAFTSLEKLRNQIQDCDVVPLTYPHIMDIVYGNNSIDGFYIDAYTMGLLITSDMMQYFSNVSRKNLKDAKNIKFGEPIEYPSVILSHIVDVLKKYESVEKAYFTLMQIEENEPEFLLVLDGEYDESEVYNSIQNRIAHLLEGAVINITNRDSHIGRQAIDDRNEPIYAK